MKLIKFGEVKIKQDQSQFQKFILNEFNFRDHYIRTLKIKHS